MQPDQKTLVVGTTSDYIHWICKSCPNQALFITDPAIRAGAQEPPPAPQDEILCDLADFNQVRTKLENHLVEYGQQLAGVASYDCESMALAAELASHFELTYPSAVAVDNCRNKYRSKILWRAKGLHTPEVRLVHSEEEAVQFQKQLDTPVVLKPLSGSGSELVLHCVDEFECRKSFRQIREGLHQRRTHRLYAGFSYRHPEILAEEMVAGDEYSCDFAIYDGRCDVIRLTRKIRAASGPFGTTKAYLLPADLPQEIDDVQFRQILLQSASALGIERAVCMLDFIIQQDRMVLLELSPRPGGDCLPYLLRCAMDLDILRFHLDFAAKKPLRLSPGKNGRPMVGLRVHAFKEGTLKDIDTSALQNDPRVRQIHLSRQQGHNISLPPKDYDAWLLGHVLFVPDGRSTVEQQCRSLTAKIRIDVSPEQRCG